MFDRLGQATGVFPPDLVDSSDEDELAHRYPNDSDSDSDSDINSEPQSDVKLIIRTGGRGKRALVGLAPGCCSLPGMCQDGERGSAPLWA